MSHYQHRMTLQASHATVYAALTTPEGLRGWWSQDSRCDSHLGGSLHFRFGPNHKTFELTLLRPHEEVQWLCTGCHMAAAHLTRRDEWVGTRVLWRLAAEPGSDGARTELHFAHQGLVPELQCWDLCQSGWDYFMDSLRLYTETGQGTPFQPAMSLEAVAE